MHSGNLNRGFLIAVEGMDGSGKSTFTKMLAAALTRLECSVLTTFEVGGTKIGKQLRDIAFNDSEEGLDPAARLLLVTAARIQHVKRVISPALESGQDVVTDRFNISTVVYQAGIDEQAELYDHLNCNLLECAYIQPDVVVYLGISPELATTRRIARKNDDNTTYKQGLELSVKISALYDKAINFIIKNRGSIKLISYIDPGCSMRELEDKAYLLAKDIIARKLSVLKENQNT